MSSIALTNTVLDKTYAQYTGSGTAGANSPTIQTAFTPGSTSLSGSPVTIAANGTMTFNKSGVHHLTISVSDPNLTGNALVPAFGIVSGSNLISSRIPFYGTFSGDVVIDSTKSYNLQILAASSSALSVSYTITFRRVGTL